jgi:hypothetical protein
MALQICAPPNLGAKCGSLFCSGLLTPGGRGVFYAGATLQGFFSLVIIVLATERVVRLCRSGRGWRSPQVVVFVHVVLVALEGLVTAIDPSGWCGVLPYGLAALLDDTASSLCFNLVMLLASAYTAAVVGQPRRGGKNRCCCAPCGVPWPLWLAMSAVVAAMVVCSTVMYLASSTAAYVLGTTYFKPILMLLIVGACSCAVATLGMRISCILRELHAVQREEQRRWIERMRGRLSDQEKKGLRQLSMSTDALGASGSSYGRDDSSSASDIESVADVSASWDPWSAASFADASAMATSAAAAAAAAAEKRTFASLHEGTSRLRHQLRKLHCTVATSLLLCALAMAAYIWDLVKGTTLVAQWKRGDCDAPFCDLYALPSSGDPLPLNGTSAAVATSSAPHMAWAIVVFYAALRLGCSACALAFFFRIRPLGGGGLAGGGGGGGGGGGRRSANESLLLHQHAASYSGLQNSYYTSTPGASSGVFTDAASSSADGDSSVGARGAVAPLDRSAGAEIIFLAGMERAEK